MAVDAVMSVVGTGLGDAVVEAVLPGREVISDSGHAIEAHAQEEPRSGPHCAEKFVHVLPKTRNQNTNLQTKRDKIPCGYNRKELRRNIV